MSTEELPPRESMEFDVVIVGAGPSGLSAAIRLKQLNADLNIVVVEKGSEVGAHILSGAVIDPVSLDKLLPDWREDADCPLKTEVKDDRFYWMTGGAAIRLPSFAMPPLMNNHHCYIGSLGNVCRWLAPKAEALGVEIYPGFAAAEVLYDDKVAVGFVVHLNYDDPYLSPFDEFQRFKTHPAIRTLFEGGKRLGYGARAITEGGYQSVPRLSFPGGALIGCAAGFVNVPRIKGVHNAMGSGMLAAEHVVAALGAGRANDELVEYENAWRDSAVGRDLHRVRNVKPLWSKFGTIIGVALGGFDMWCNTLGFSLFGTQSHAKPDRKTLDAAKTHTPIAYPKPDGKLTFDKLSSVFLSNTNHEEDQPVHLKVADMNLQKVSEHDVYAGPSNRYCPAGVYEWVEETTGPRFQINAQNCVHCKTCDVKDPNGNITWVPPEGGGGPNYQGM